MLADRFERLGPGGLGWRGEWRLFVDPSHLYTVLPGGRTGEPVTFPNLQKSPAETFDDVRQAVDSGSCSRSSLGPGGRIRTITQDQKMNLNPNCMTRPGAATEITPRLRFPT